MIDMLIEKQNAADNGFNEWTINGQRFAMPSKQAPFELQHGKALPATRAQRQR